MNITHLGFDMQQAYLHIFHKVGMERNRQISLEYTAASDDRLTDYLCSRALENIVTAGETCYHETRKTHIIKAMALLVAEFQRLERKEKKINAVLAI